MVKEHLMDTNNPTMVDINNPIMVDTPINNGILLNEKK